MAGVLVTEHWDRYSDRLEAYPTKSHSLGELCDGLECCDLAHCVLRSTTGSGGPAIIG